MARLRRKLSFGEKVIWYLLGFTVCFIPMLLTSMDFILSWFTGIVCGIITWIAAEAIIRIKKYGE